MLIPRLAETLLKVLSFRVEAKLSIPAESSLRGQVSVRPHVLSHVPQHLPAAARSRGRSATPCIVERQGRVVGPEGAERGGDVEDLVADDGHLIVNGQKRRSSHSSAEAKATGRPSVGLGKSHAG
jgi:hypothetical protein